jgi:hypothetical protein
VDILSEGLHLLLVVGAACLWLLVIIAAVFGIFAFCCGVLYRIACAVNLAWLVILTVAARLCIWLKLIPDHPEWFEDEPLVDERKTIA